MEIQITKGPSDLSTFVRYTVPFSNARTALKAFLLGLGFSSNDEVLLPAYIGWSPREGSGVFDPLIETGVRYRFYRVTRDLRIDLEDLYEKIDTKQPRLLLIIHYFGYPDENYTRAVKYARSRGMLILEDEAHALFSDWVEGICGRAGDAAIMSLHKMLPCRSGGLLVLNDSLDDAVIDTLKCSALQTKLEQNPLDYDLLRISAARRCNAVHLHELLLPLKGKVDPLYPRLPDKVIPQTLPVIVTGKSRRELYLEMNASGYGVVSLYHTLIDPIEETRFPDSYWLAKHILNLPVHQDISYDALEGMVAKLAHQL